MVRLPATAPVDRAIGDGRRGSWPGPGRRAAEPGCRAAIGLIAFVALVASPFIALVPAMSGALDRGWHQHLGGHGHPGDRARASARWPGRWPCRRWPNGWAGAP